MQESLNWRASVKFNIICLLSKLSFILVFWGREFIAHIMFLRTVFQQKWVLVGFLTTPVTAKIKLLSQQVQPRLWDLLVMLTEAYPGGSFSFMGSSIKYCGGYVKAKYLDLRRCKQPGSNRMVGTYQQHRSCIFILLGYYWMSLSESLYIMAPLWTYTSKGSSTNSEQPCRSTYSNIKYSYCILLASKSGAHFKNGICFPGRYW